MRFDIITENWMPKTFLKLILFLKFDNIINFSRLFLLFPNHILVGHQYRNAYFCVDINQTQTSGEGGLKY